MHCFIGPWSHNLDKKDPTVIVWSDEKLKIRLQFLAPPNILPPNYHSYNYNEHQDKGN
jgi:hypothetical protein